MQASKKSFLNVLHFVAQYFTPEWDSDLYMIDLPNKQVINVGQDSEWDIQVNLTDMDEEPLDGGGCVSMDDCMEIDKMTPEEYSQLVTDKALFIWELIHTS